MNVFAIRAITTLRIGCIRLPATRYLGPFGHQLVETQLHRTVCRGGGLSYTFNALNYTSFDYYSLKGIDKMYISQCIKCDSVR
jgi:hypothetical protein